MRTMGASAVVDAGKPVVRIRGTAYPVLLPTLRDPRLHLAAVIISLQVLGQTSFNFSLSIAQILVSVLTCAVLEIAITFPHAARAHVARERAADRKRRRLHPSRAGHRARRLVEHERLVDLRGYRGDLAAFEVRDQVQGLARLQSVELRARHLLPVARPGAGRPARLLVGPMSLALALALVIITVGGLSILSRLEELLEIAVGFWVAFALGLQACSQRAATR